MTSVANFGRSSNGKLTVRSTQDTRPEMLKADPPQEVKTVVRIQQGVICITTDQDFFIIDEREEYAPFCTPSDPQPSPSNAYQEISDLLGNDGDLDVMPNEEHILNAILEDQVMRYIWYRAVDWSLYRITQGHIPCRGFINGDFSAKLDAAIDRAIADTPPLSCTSGARDRAIHSLSEGRTFTPAFNPERHWKNFPKSKRAYSVLAHIASHLKALVAAALGEAADSRPCEAVSQH